MLEVKAGEEALQWIAVLRRTLSQQLKAGVFYKLTGPENIHTFRRPDNGIADRIPLVHVNPSRLHGQMQSLLTLAPCFFDPPALRHISNDDGKQLPTLDVRVGNGRFYRKNITVRAETP